MANDTFGQIWNRVLLHAPNLPPPLAKDFVQAAYSDILSGFYWSELRADAEVLIPDYYTTGTIDVTNGSTTVTGTDTVWVDAHVGQQLAIEALAPWYTITAVGSNTSLTIDRAYEGADDTDLTYEIGQYYVDFPTDLAVLERIRDQTNGWYLATQWYSQQWLDRVDPQRNTAGTPTLVVAAPPRTDSSGNVIPRYEFWPRETSEHLYHYRYTTRHSLTANSTRILDAVRPDTVLYGALKQAAMWPGTAEAPNPVFGIDKQEAYSKLYERFLEDDIHADVDRVQTMIQEADGGPRRFPADAAYLQAHFW